MPVLTANYPALIPSFSTKIDLQDIVFANHINQLQLEVVAIAKALGATPTGSAATVKDRIAAVEESLAQLATTVSSLGGGSQTPTSIPESSVTGLVADLTNIENEIAALQSQVGGGSSNTAGFVTLANPQTLTGAKVFATGSSVAASTDSGTASWFALMAFQGATKYMRVRSFGGQSAWEVATQTNQGIQARLSVPDSGPLVAQEQWYPLNPWTDVTGSLVNGWHSVSGSTIQIMKTADGTIHTRGGVSGGNTGQVFSLPSWAVPAYNHYWHGAGPNGDDVTFQITSGVVNVISGWTNGSSHDVHIDTSYYAGV